MPDAGRLFLVVGPSGVGKDSLLDHARKHFSGHQGIVFPQRYITRPTDAGGEVHVAVTEDEFRKLSETGAFALEWQAHGLAYGVPADIKENLAVGRHVVVNVSRAILDGARGTFDKLTILSVVASAEAVSQRLQARGREDADEIVARLSRYDHAKPAGPDVVEIDNSDTFEIAAQQFTDAIEADE